MVCKLTAGRKAWWASSGEGQGLDSAPGESGVTADRINQIYVTSIEMLSFLLLDDNFTVVDFYATR